MRCPTTLKLVDPVLGPLVIAAMMTTGVSYEIPFVMSDFFAVLLIEVVTDILSVFIYDILALLHLTEVAELHSDSSHAVLPTRADGDFSSPKFAPSTKTKLEPENKIRALRVTCNG
jgi:uncharacterized membrane protein YbjE (DUF340 family)